MMARRRDIGTDDPRVKVRPGKQRRPRTKKRPDYSHAPIGQVTSIDRGRYHVYCDGIMLIAVKARSLGRRGVIVGDRVRLNGDLSGTKDTLARIVDICERRSQLTRSSEDNEVAGVIKPIVANATQMAVVSACADPPPRIGMIDRCLVAAYAAGIRPLIVMTKKDLADPTEFLRPYVALDVPCFITSAHDSAHDSTHDSAHGDALSGLDALKEALRGEETVMIGHSGVGKSTLMNALIPQTGRATGHVNEVTGRGRHTSSSLWAERFGNDGWLIDTPGVRGFGLAHIDNDMILQAFSDLREACLECPKGCAHTADQPGCALDRWAAGDEVRAVRLQSFRRLISTARA